MNTVKFFGVLSVVASLCGTTLAGVTVKVNEVVPRDSISGIVEIEYAISYDGGTKLTPDECLEVYTVDDSVKPAMTNRVWNFLETPLPTSAGTHRITWDSKADGVTELGSNTKVHVCIAHYGVEYMVIDISGGSTAKQYPVTYLNAAPPGGFCTDEYRGDKMVLRRIHPGSYVAGSPKTEANRASSETQYRVILTNDFYIGIFELTKYQWQNVQNTDPWGTTTEATKYTPAEYLAYERCRGGNWPDDKTSNNDSYLHNLSKRCVNASDSTLIKGFDLPTEAQWEYACRAGATTGFSTTEAYDDTSAAAQEAVMATLGRYGQSERTDYVKGGLYLPNAWGLYDMHGNVWEWCRDTWANNLANLNQLVEPIGNPVASKYHTARGGACNSVYWKCRAAFRYGSIDTSNYYTRSHNMGMRVACVRVADSAPRDTSWRTEWAVSSAKPLRYYAAALAERTEAVDVVRAITNPWRVSDSSELRSSLVAGAEQSAGDVSDVTFVVKGRGTFSSEYALEGGSLQVIVDGESVKTLSSPVDWTADEIVFDDFAAHTIIFRHTAAGDGTTASVKNVKWLGESGSCGLSGESSEARVDLRPGVRMGRRLYDIWPIQYSCTNWIGDVARKDGYKPVAEVTAVQVTGTAEDVSTWTEEVAGTAETLYRSTGEGEVKWEPKRAGVWKQTFRILDIKSDLSSVVTQHTETAFFDLRKAMGRGFMIIIDGRAKSSSGGGTQGLSLQTEPGQDIVLNNGEYICVYDGTKDFGEQGALLWKWRAADDPNLPSDYRPSGFSEAKPLNGGAWIGLVGGYYWVILDASTHQAIGWGSAPGNPHSIELLSNDILAVVSTDNSHAVHLYDISGSKMMNPSQQNRKAFKTASGHTFSYPHGLHWDAAAQKLWVVGSDGLSKCTVGYSGGTFSLTVDKNWPTVVGGETCTDAHDLRPIPGTSKLVMTTVEKVLFFDMSKEAWLPDETLGYGYVKCFDPGPSGRRFLVQVPNSSWASNNIWLWVRNGNGVSKMYQNFRTLPSGVTYKARWIPRN